MSFQGGMQGGSRFQPAQARPTAQMSVVPGAQEEEGGGFLGGLLDGLIGVAGAVAPLVGLLNPVAGAALGAFSGVGGVAKNVAGGGTEGGITDATRGATTSGVERGEAGEGATSADYGAAASEGGDSIGRDDRDTGGLPWGSLTPDEQANMLNEAFMRNPAATMAALAMQRQNMDPGGGFGALAQQPLQMPSYGFHQFQQGQAPISPQFGQPLPNLQQNISNALLPQGGQ